MTLFCDLNLSLEYILSFCYKNEIIVPVLNVIKNCDWKLLLSPHNTIKLIGFYFKHIWDLDSSLSISGIRHNKLQNIGCWHLRLKFVNHAAVITFFKFNLFDWIFEVAYMVDGN